MKHATLVRTGIGGSVIAMVCCVTPVLALAFGALGLSAWLAFADYVLIPALLLFVAMAAFGYWRQRRATARCDTEAPVARMPRNEDRVSNV